MTNTASRREIARQEVSLVARIRQLSSQNREQAQRSFEEDLAKGSPDARGSLLPVALEARNPSRQYTLGSNRIFPEGSNARAIGRKTFLSERKKLSQRVLKDADILLMGPTDFVDADYGRGFDPTVIMFDAASRASLATVFVPLVQSKNWQALLLFGDERQLGVHCPSDIPSEVTKNAQMSAVDILVGKGYPTNTLLQQYRMCPAIYQFPSRHFYDGKLQS
ncbi:MAG: hypothetical protein Q9203_001456 [Teloschistes exilis]